MWTHRHARVTALLVILVDVGSKVLSRGVLPDEGVPLPFGVVLRVFENTRGPFGLGPLWLTLLASIVVLVLLVRARLLTAHYSLRTGVSLGLLLGGGLANLGERLLFGRVTDLLVLEETTALNLADVAVLVGLILLVAIAVPLCQGFGGQVRRLPGPFARAQAVQRARKKEAKRRILVLLDERGAVANDDVQRLLGVSDATATNYLGELEREGVLRQVGRRGRGVVYRRNG